MPSIGDKRLVDLTDGEKLGIVLTLLAGVCIGIGAGSVMAGFGAFFGIFGLANLIPIPRKK